MANINDYYLFIIAGIILNITPGVDLLYILNIAFKKGFKASLIAVLGINTGCLFHMFIAVVGLSAILLASPSAFMFVKYLGVVYLIYLGIQVLFKKENKKKIADVSNKNIFTKAILINILNPKVALFFIAFLPQFIKIDSNDTSFSFFILGSTFIFVSIIINIIISYSCLIIKNRFTYTNNLIKLINKIVGVLFISFGIKLAIEI